MIDSLLALFLGASGAVFAQEMLLVRQSATMLIYGWSERNYFVMALFSAMLLCTVAFGVACMIAVLAAIHKYTSMTVPLGAFAAGVVGVLLWRNVPLFKSVSCAERPPRFYGVAWLDYNTGRCTCMPMPLNVIARLFRMAWLHLKYAGCTIPRTTREAYHAGYRQAVKDAQDNL